MGLLGAFVSPALFVGGAAAMSVPIIIHLLARRRFKRIRWAAMDFLIDAERRNRRRIRMEEWILLALRCLAILLIALIVSRPFLQPGGLASALGGLRQTERIIVLDDSLSMDLQSADGTSFDRAKLAVRRLLEGIRRETPDDTITVLRGSDVARPVDAGTYLDDRQTDDLLERVSALTPTFGALDVPGVVRGVAEYLERNESIINAAVYFVSDFQAHDWVGTNRQNSDGETSGGQNSGDKDSNTDSPQSLFSPLADWASSDRDIRVVCINVGDPDARNIAVTSLSSTGGKWVAGTTGRIRVRVANYSDVGLDPQPLEVTYGSLALAAPTVPALAPGQEATIDVDVDLVQSGRVAMRITLGDDALPADNTRHFVADVARALRVLIVNGEPAPDLIDDEVGLLATALRPEGEVFSGNECTIVDEVEMESATLTEFDVVVLANVYRLSEPVVAGLEQFVQRGGGLLVFLGDQVDPDLYNDALFKDGAGLLPVRFVEIVRVADAVHLVITDPLHRVMRGLAGDGDPLGIGRVAFRSFVRCELPDEDGIVDETPSVGAVRVLARFDDERESPAILEYALGAGTVLLVTTSADKEWHQLPDHPAFVPIVNEMVHHVARGVGLQTDQWVGAPLEIALDPARYEVDALIRTPLYPEESETSISAVASDDGAGLELRWDRTPTPGVYQFVLHRRDGGDDVRSIAVNIDPAESNLSACGEDDLRRVAGDVPLKYLQGVDALATDAGAGRTEFWRLSLILAVMVLMTEQTLAWWWGRRR